MPNEPIRHHYIPQFILRNFCFDEQKRHLFYYSKADGEISVKSPRDIFMENNFYRSEILNKDDPTELEKTFAVYEKEIAELIKDKILGKEKIVLTMEEKESLALFCALLAYRGTNAHDFFAGLKESDKKTMLELYQNDREFEEFWIRNLCHAARYRSMKDIYFSTDVDIPMKGYLAKVATGFSGTYFVFFERRGRQDFILSDCYPTVTNGIADDGKTLPLIHHFPLTPTFMMGLVPIEAKLAPTMEFMKDKLRKPKIKRDGTIENSVIKLYEPYVKMVNKSAFDSAKNGVAASDKTFIEACFPKKEE